MRSVCALGVQGSTDESVIKCVNCNPDLKMLGGGQLTD